MLLPFSIREAEWQPVWVKAVHSGLTVRVFRGRWSNIVCVLLSLLVLRVGCGM